MAKTTMTIRRRLSRFTEVPPLAYLITRRIIQSVRRYTVFIDEDARGQGSRVQKAWFPVSVGDHRVQLRIVNTGTSDSAEFIVDVQADETRVLRTHRHNSTEYLEALAGNRGSRPICPETLDRAGTPGPLTCTRRLWHQCSLDNAPTAGDLGLASRLTWE